MKKIYKSAAIIIKNGLLLVVKKKGTDIFISPGGKPKKGETHLQCLKRELLEELQVSIIEAKYFGTFSDIAEFEHTEIEIQTSIVTIIGMPRANQEIDEIAWIDPLYANYPIKIGSIFANYIIPRLLALGMMYQRSTPKLHSKKIFVFDLDGTLIFDGAPLQDAIKQSMVKVKKNGHGLVVATSRASRGIREVLNDFVDYDYLIACNGAIIENKQGLLYKVTIEESFVFSIIEYLKTLKIDFYVDYNHEFLICGDRHAFPNMHHYSDVKYVDFNFSFQCVGVVKIVIHANNHRELDVIKFSEVNIIMHESGMMEITHALADKFIGVDRCISCANNHMIVFGNDDNDFSLLTSSHQGYIVGERLLALDRLPHITRMPAKQESLIHYIEENS